MKLPFLAPSIFFTILVLVSVFANVLFSKVNRPAVLGVSITNIWNSLFSKNKSTLFNDKIEAKSRFADLPDDIKVDLDKIYAQQSIKSGIYWQMSQASRKATSTIFVANFINTINGGVTAALKGGKEAVADWFAEELAKNLGKAILAETTTEKKAEFTIVLLDAAKLDHEIISKGFKAAASNTDIYLSAASWVLETEMAYINTNLSQGYQKLAAIDLWTGLNPLDVYIIGIEGENKITGLFDKGVKFYYFDYSKNKYVNYFNDVVASKLKDAKLQTGQSESTTGAVVNQTTSTSCQKVNLAESYQTYYFYKSASPCSSYSRSTSSSRFSVRCNQASSQWREHYVKEIATNGASTLKIKASLGLKDYAHFFGTGVKSDDYVDLIILSSKPNPTLAAECNKSVAEADWSKCGISNSNPASLGHCGVPKNSEGRSCNFEVSTSGKSSVWAVLRVADAWLADVEGSLSNLEICPQ